MVSNYSRCYTKRINVARRGDNQTEMATATIETPLWQLTALRQLFFIQTHALVCVQLTWIVVCAWTMMATTNIKSNIALIMVVCFRYVQLHCNALTNGRIMSKLIMEAFFLCTIKWQTFRSLPLPLSLSFVYVRTSAIIVFFPSIFLAFIYFPLKHFVRSIRSSWLRKSTNLSGCVFFLRSFVSFYFDNIVFSARRTFHSHSLCFTALFSSFFFYFFASLIFIFPGRFDVIYYVPGTVNIS